MEDPAAVLGVLSALALAVGCGTIRGIDTESNGAVLSLDDDVEASAVSVAGSTTTVVATKMVVTPVSEAEIELLPELASESLI